MTIPVRLPNYRPNNVLNFRGGNQQDTELFFDVQVNADTVEEPPEVFFVNITASRTAIVLTPSVAITICGGALFYPLLSHTLILYFIFF